MKKSAILPVAVLLLIALAPHAHAADILDQLMTSYRTVSGQVIGRITTPLLGTFFSLSVITLAIELGLAAVQGGDQWMVILVRWILSVGLGIWLITNAENFSHLILNSMGYLAGLADSRSISATSILLQGIAASHAAADAADAVGVLHIGTAIAMGVGSWIVLGCFVVMSGAIVVMTIEFYLVACVCLVMAPLIGLPWTRSIGVDYWVGLLRYAIGVFAVAICAVVAFTFTDQWLQTVKGTGNHLSWDDLALLVAQSATLAYAVVRVPATCMRAVGSPSTMSGMGFFQNSTYLARSAVGVAASAGARAVSAVGAATAVGSAARLATRQTAGSNQSTAGRVASIAGLTVSNVAGGVSRDIGRRLSGQSLGRGVTGFRVASDLSRQTGTPSPRPAKPQA